MKQIIGKQNGFALVYALVTLLVACVGGTAVLFMSQRGRIQATDYAKMRSSSLAASAALKACEAQFSTDPATTQTLLNAFPTKPWLLGSAPSVSEVKVKFWNGSDSPEYSARILRYDNITQMIIIEGIGYGSNGGRKKVIASYHLDGFKISDCPIGANYALFLGGSLQNCNSRIYVKGDVYLSMQGGSSSQHFNAGGKIEGNLKTASTSNVLDFTSAGALYVTGNSFMQCQLSPQGLFKTSGNAGFTYNGFSNFTSAMLVDGNAYFTQTTNFGFANCIDGDNGGNKTVYYNTSKISADRFKDFTYKAQIPTSTAAYVATQLGMTTNNDSAFVLNLPGSWEAGVTKDISGITVTGENVDSWWDEKKNNNKLYLNEWLVVNLTGKIKMNGGTFKRKAIWITNNYKITIDSKWYNCDLASNTILIVNGTGFLEQMGVPSNSVFRGIIYITKDNTTTNNIYKFGSNAIVYGAIQHAGNTQFNLNGQPSDTVKIWYADPIGQSAIQEIVNTGLLYSPGQSAPSPKVPTLIDIKIRPKLLSIQL